MVGEKKILICCYCSRQQPYSGSNQGGGYTNPPTSYGSQNYGSQTNYGSGNPGYQGAPYSQYDSGDYQSSGYPSASQDSRNSYGQSGYSAPDSGYQSQYSNAPTDSYAGYNNAAGYSSQTQGSFDDSRGYGAPPTGYGELVSYLTYETK